MKTMNLDMQSELELERVRIQAQLGEDVSVERPQWVELMKQGVLVRLHIRRWRARSKVNFEDLGLPAPKDEKKRKQFDALMTLGTKWLLPAQYVKQLDSIDSGARKHLEKFAFQTHWGDFVAFTAYAEWKHGNCGFEQRYLAVRDDIYGQWKDIQRALRAGYRKQAATAYERLLKLDRDLLRGERGVIPQDEFVKRYLERLEMVVPEREVVRDSFAYETELAYIPLPSLLADDVAKKARADLELEKVQFEEVLTREKAGTEMRAIRERDRLLAQMNADVVSEARQQQKHLVDEFLVGVESQLLGSLYDGLSNVLDSMDKNGGVLVGKAAEQIRGTLRLAETLNFTNNVGVAQQIASVRNVIDRPVKERNAAQLQVLLSQITAANGSALKEMGYTPRAKRGVGVVEDVPEMESARRGRRL